MKKSLLLGCGHSRKKRLALRSSPDWAGDLVTLDMSPDVGADVVWNLEDRPLPFDDEEFDEVGAFDVLEHIGRQGDWRGFFDEFAEYWRVLKPGGLFHIIVPINEGALNDPGHTRFFTLTVLGFLRQKFYQENLDKGTPVTDYRWYYKRNFEFKYVNKDEGHLCVILEKV